MVRKDVDMVKQPAPQHFSALREIRDRAYMLSLGNVYLCEDVFLKKIGKDIEPMLDSVRNDILTLKKKFPGKFASDVDTESILEELHSKAEELKNPDEGMNDRCTAGELGRDLEETVQTLTSAIKAIIAKVEGELPEYTAKDAVIDALGKAKAPASMVTRLVRMAVKMIIFLVILALGPLAYLFITMEREGSLLKGIRESEAQIQANREMIGSLEKERLEVTQKIEAMKREDAARQDKIELMELNVQVHGLDERRGKAETENVSLENTIKENRAKIESIKKKPFLERLLRR